MRFDIDETLSDMLKAIKAVVKDNWPMVKDNANTYLQDRRLRLELLVSLRLSGEIEEAFFRKRLKDEKKVLESELHSIAIMSKAIAQKAANAALDVLDKAIDRVLRL